MNNIFLISMYKSNILGFVCTMYTVHMYTDKKAGQLINFVAKSFDFYRVQFLFILNTVITFFLHFYIDLNILKWNMFSKDFYFIYLLKLIIKASIYY